MPTATYRDFPTEPGRGWIQLLEDGLPWPRNVVYELPYGGAVIHRSRALKRVVEWAENHAYKIRYTVGK